MIGQDQDITGGYRRDISALPVARGPEDMPQPTLGELWTAGVTLAAGDRSNGEMERVKGAYDPILQELNRGRPWFRRFANPGEWNGDGADRPIFGGSTERERSEAEIWAEIARRRTADPTFLAGVPSTIEEFHKQISEAEAKRRDAAREMQARNGTVAGSAAGLLGGMAKSLDDPLTIATLPVGGGGRTVARRIITEGLAQAAIEGVQQPLIAERREQIGETLTAGEAASNVVTAGVLGAGIQGVVAEPLGALARKHIGWERLTDTERAAVHVEERAAEIDATSPFEPGPGSEAHAERLEALMRSILADEPVSARARAMAGTSLGSAPVPRETSAISRGTSAPSVDDVFESLVVQESGGRPGIAGPPTPWGRAYGLTQVLDSTGEGVARKLGVPWRPELMRGTSAEAAAYQRKIGRAYFEEGLRRYDGDVRKALMYYHGGPDEKQWGPKTRGYAEAVIKRAGGEPVLKREGFAEGDAGDLEWAAAQREVDAADLELAVMRRGRDAAEPEGDVPEFALEREIEDAVARADAEFDAATAPLMADFIKATEGVRSVEKLAALAEKHGQAMQPHVQEYREAMDAIEPGHDPYPRSRAGAPVRATMEALDEASPLGPRSVLTAQPERGAPGLSIIDEDGQIATAVYRDDAGIARGVAQIPLTPEAREIVETASVYVDPAFRRQGIGTRLYDALRAEGYPIERQSGAGDMTPDGAAFVNAWRKRPAPPVLETTPTAAVDAMAVQRFDDPAGSGSDAQVQSIDHDLRLLAEAEPGASFRLGEEGDERGLADVIAEWDAGAAAIEAIRGCL